MRSRQDAAAQGVKLRDTSHNMKRRAPWHDYRGRGLYLVTLVVEGRRPLLGRLSGTPVPHVCLSPLGEQILREEIGKINQLYPNVSVWKSVIMPDHMHLILYVAEPFVGRKHLSNVIAGFKSGCNNAYRSLANLTCGSLFEWGYNDKVLLQSECLDKWKRYLDDNPRRLWTKRNNPDLFTVINRQEVGGRLCNMIGNKFLLDVPDKIAVIYHRRYTDDDLGTLYRDIMRCGEMGGVLVSAAIAKWEKMIMREAMDKGFKIILLRENGFPTLYKPSGESFDACAAGRLLQISPWEYHFDRTTITREQCLSLNSLAEKIVTL